MSAKQISPLLKAWYRWKSLRLPWRNRFLVGLDLQGNTYWEFRLRGSGSGAGADRSLGPAHRRFRRIVQYPRGAHLSEVKVPPQWHQWLRYGRDEAPSLRDQAADLVRRERMRVLAAEADARWEAKPSFLDMPTPPPTTKDGSSNSGVKPRERGREREPEEQERVARGQEQEQEQKQDDRGRREKSPPPRPQKENDPWKRAQQGGPSEKWQPAAWTPSAGARRR